MCVCVCVCVCVSHLVETKIAVSIIFDLNNKTLAIS